MNPEAPVRNWKVRTVVERSRKFWFRALSTGHAGALRTAPKEVFEDQSQRGNVFWSATFSGCQRARLTLRDNRI